MGLGLLVHSLFIPLFSHFFKHSLSFFHVPAGALETKISKAWSLSSVAQGLVGDRLCTENHPVSSRGSKRGRSKWGGVARGPAWGLQRPFQSQVSGFCWSWNAELHVTPLFFFHYPHLNYLIFGVPVSIGSFVSFYCFRELSLVTQVCSPQRFILLSLFFKKELTEIRKEKLISPDEPEIRTHCH